ncbi:hypothetical protein [Shewanella holmiensis]|uniref:Uncharacterized protein n=1 Tax=Shewanella holmiensis TaxID=2952222 RepID=A0A9X3AVA3_9GAMM|nr:hypothetical protein [Shewanella holmiensis]MCT7942425.1 hypothetical protein [Shewanella holmiensis]
MNSVEQFISDEQLAQLLPFIQFNDDSVSYWCVPDADCYESAIVQGFLMGQKYCSLRQQHKRLSVSTVDIVEQMTEHAHKFGFMYAIDLFLSKNDKDI